MDTLKSCPLICNSVGPDGRILSAPEPESEKLILADLDLSLVTKTKTFADASGHCECNLFLRRSILS